MLDSKTVSLMGVLLERGSVSLAEFAIVHQLTKKQAWYEIEQLNARLETISDARIQLHLGQLTISPQLRSDWLANVSTALVLNHHERCQLIILYTYIKQTAVSQVHYQQLLQMSKNSVVIALKKVKEQLGQFSLELSYSRQHGYAITGAEQAIRRCIETTLQTMRRSPQFEQLFALVFSKWGLKQSTADMAERLTTLAQTHKVSFVAERFEHLVAMLSLVQVAEQTAPLVFTVKQKHYGQSHRLRVMAETIVKQLRLTTDTAGNVIFVTAQLLASLQGEHEHPQPEFRELTEAIIDEVQRLTLTVFDHRSQLSASLYQHVVPCFYRLLFGASIANPYVATIKAEYADIYTLVHKGLRPLEAALDTTLEDAEIAYFTIHFGGQLQFPSRERQIRALTVCPNGVSSSIIMQQQLQDLFPSITFETVHSVSDSQQLAPESYDLIFSTIYFQTSKPLYVTKPILNPVEKELLKRQLQRDFQLQQSQNQLNANAVIALVKRHADIKDETALFKGISRLLNVRRQDEGGVNLTDLLIKDHIQQSDEALSWQAAITLAAQPLLADHYITADYVAAMIAMVEEVGPYIVLAPQVAIPHARPENGGKKLGMSLLQMKVPVDFDLKQEGGDDYQVKLLFVLSTVDNDSHLTALKQLSNILEDDETIDALINASSTDELLAIIKLKGSADND